ncbi:hypothetical protein GCM10007981_09720 [Thermocladium modestius]|uniref:Uncharacterized protein n=1 Tax=Thermocladium modestius TaxID=62609 RepID=A0A830GT89_9CREN|nr:hypothetical protein [Thermocladium modestius]GGP20677.1 hypothetical protein GCM10007981_09720 [Thermocladium modestius]
MQSETRVKCPKCGREHSIMVNPSLLEEAAKGGLAQIAIPCGDHVLLAYVDRYGMVRRTSTTLLVTGAGPSFKTGTISINWSSKKLVDESIISDVLGDEYLNAIKDALSGKSIPTPELESLMAKLSALGLLVDKIG